MKRALLLFLTLLLALPIMAEEKNEKKLNYKFYGFIRTDFAFNTRESRASTNDIFYLYPLDVNPDAAGEDLNENASSGFFAFASRVGIDITGGKVGNANATAKLETDFAGFSASNTMLRIRHAYVNLDWESGSSLLVGQTWHPLFGSVMPYITNLSTGAPFQPFNRSPQVRYQYNLDKFKFTAAALCQLQYNSSGPNSDSTGQTTSNEFMRNSCIPEFYAGVDYTSGGWLFGGGVNILTLAPRTQSEKNGDIYKVDESMSAVSGEAHMRYYGKKLKIGMKSIFASALDHTMLIGGYGVTEEVDSVTGEQSYTPIRNSTTWLNVTYGTTWCPTLYVGYTKNLGTSEELLDVDKIYGYGADIDQLLGVNLGLSYNKPSWSVGVEYSTTTAWYGDIDLASGRVKNTHDVTNHRVAAIMVYRF